MPKKNTVGKIQLDILKSVQSHGGTIQRERQLWLTADGTDITPLSYKAGQQGGYFDHSKVRRAASGLISGGFLRMISDDSNELEITPLGLRAIELGRHEPAG